MRWLRILGWTVGGLVVLVGVLFAGLQTPPGKALVAAVVSSDDIRIEGVERLHSGRPARREGRDARQEGRVAQR